MPGPNSPDLNDLQYLTASGQASQFNPNDHGLLAWSFDPALAVNNTVLAAAGTLYGARVHNRSQSSVSNVHAFIATAGVTLTGGQCFAGLYDQNGNLLGSSADQATSWQTTGFKTMALTGAPIAVPAGDLYVAFFANGTTLPALARSAGISALNNANISSGFRFMSANTGLTTALPATLSAMSAAPAAFWVGIS